MRVKLLRPSSTPSVSTDADVFTSRWSRLSAFINAVQALRHEVSAPPRFSLEELHSDVVDVCLVHDASKLFLHLREKFESRVAALMRPLEAEAAGAFESPFIDNVAVAWNTYCKEVSFIMMVFLHLDRSYVMELPGSQSLWDVGIAIWGATFSQHERIVAVAVRRLCELIRKEREGEVVDRNVLATLTGMFQAVSLFSSAIVPPVLAATKEFYEVEGVKLINSCDVPAYLLNIETRLRREVRLFRAHQQRPLRITSYGPSTVIPKTLQIDAAGAYFDSTSKEGASLQRSILKCVDCALIERHAGTLVERGLAHLLEQRNREDLKRLYQFLSRVGHTNTLRIHFGHYIKSTASKIVGVEGNDEHDKQLVQGLLDLKDAMDSIISFAFSGSELFMTTLRSSLESSINARQDRPAELIAKYVDARMKSGGQDSEVDCQRALDKVMILFRCIHGKDVFEAYYKKDLAKRLLLARSQSTDLEKYMVMMLKGECGAAFTENLEYMFEDIKLTRELNDAFAAETAASAASSSANNVGLYVHVLTTSHWPSYPAMPVNLPEDFASAAARFQSFYSSKHRKTRLTWLPSVSYCLLRASFPNGRKDLDVSQLQALVLLLFNSQSSMSAAEIREATGIAGDELTRTLQSLSLGQVRVLKKESKGREVIDADVFSYNADFTHSLVRIKINQIQIKETKVEQDATNEKIVEDRQHVIDAVIVRIMKSRKVIKHLQLMTEVLAQLRFSAQAADIKKRIASLIEREYMARQDDDSSAYVYVS